MQSGRIYIGMMFSSVESVSTWPDAPFKYVRDREKAIARRFLDSEFVGRRFNNRRDDREFIATAVYLSNTFDCRWATIDGLLSET